MSINWKKASDPPSDDRLIWLQHHEGNSLNTLPDLMACRYVNGQYEQKHIDRDGDEWTYLPEDALRWCELSDLQLPKVE